jgi:uncharacterized protein (TIGR00369 family)
MNQTPIQYLPTYQGCFVCGQKSINSASLNLRFRVTEEGVVVRFTPKAEQEGYKNVVHGGIICSVLDETIGWAVAVARKKFFVTGELSVRFLKPILTGHEIIVSGRVLEHKSRYSIATGEIKDNEGVLYTKATGKFFLMNEHDASKVNEYLTYRTDDVEILVER